MAGIYIHVPFCKQACSYCNFYFITRQSEKDAFVAALIEEIESYKNSKFAEEPVETIYFGGGTPSLLELEQVEAILSTLADVFNLDLQEITFEMNPDDVTTEYLSGLKKAGITRASMGIQSFQPELLEFMNRAHNRNEALQSLELLKEADFPSFTADIIYGNPNQTVKQLLDDVELLMRFNPPHISAYSLTVEPNTRLGKQVKLNRIIPAGDDEVARHFVALNKYLSKHGLERYEVSNYSRKGAEAIHNSNYWIHQNYLGLGPAAHSFWWYKKDANGRRFTPRSFSEGEHIQDRPQRWQNEPDTKNYPTKNEPEYLTMQQLAEERIMMGLRSREGVSKKELEKRYNYTLNNQQMEYLQKKENEEKLKLNDSISLTDDGILIADAIILDLVTLH